MAFLKQLYCKRGHERTLNNLTQKGECKICKKENSKNWKQSIRKNPEKDKETQKKYRENHREQYNTNSKEWRKNNPDRYLEINKKYKNSDKGRATSIARRRDKINTLHTTYIAELLGAPASIIPTEVIEAKRLQIQLYREKNKCNFKQ